MADPNYKKRVALSSVFASLIMTITKLVVGVMTGSLGILSEALHSFLDLGAASLTYFAVRVSDRPADPGHPYGHGKVEALTALIETGLLFVTGAWIIYEAVLRLMGEPVAIETTWYSLAVMIMSIGIDISRSRALMKAAKETRSQALEADALHFSSDILSSVVVLVGLGGVAAGYPKADAIAAIGVSLFVFHIGYGLGKRTIDVLVDAAPAGIAEQLKEIAQKVDGVECVAWAKARPAGSTVFVEILIRVSRLMPLDRAQTICDQVTVAVGRKIVGAEIFVKAEPLALDDETILDEIRSAAIHRGVMIHDVLVHAVGEKQHVSFDIEVDECMNIRDAHAVASAIEQDVQSKLGDDLVITSHIDPRRRLPIAGRPLDEALRLEIKDKIENLACSVAGVQAAHRIDISLGEDGLYLSLHCLFASETSVGEVHHSTTAVEHLLLQHIKDVGRVVVHAEPIEVV